LYINPLFSTFYMHKDKLNNINMINDMCEYFTVHSPCYESKLWSI